MRIAFVTEVWKPSINGVVTRLSVTIDELIAAGHEVLVIAPTVDQRGDVSDAEARPGLQVRRMPSVRIRFIYGGQPWGLPLRRMQRMLAAFDPDLVHVVAPALLGLGAVRAAKRLRVPLVASFHTDIAGYAKFYHLGFLVPFIWWWLRRLHNAAAINLVTSSYSARLLAEHGIQHVVHWQRGVDVQLFDPARRTRGREGGAGAAAAAGAEGAAGSAAGEGAAADASALPLALYVGRLAWEKGLQRLETLVRSGSVQLEVIGDGPDRERLERIFDGTPTRFLGAVTGV
ncbi:MAG TPA: glycosyltransferase, partial [Microbacteriaceae bacterium]